MSIEKNPAVVVTLNNSHTGVGIVYDANLEIKLNAKSQRDALRQLKRQETADNLAYQMHHQPGELAGKVLDETPSSSGTFFVRIAHATSHRYLESKPMHLEVLSPSLSHVLEEL